MSTTLPAPAHAAPVAPEPIPAAAVAQLRAQLVGPVHTVEDPGYDAARAGWNLAVQQRPALVVEPVGPDDVVVVMRFARATGLPVAVQATGHGPAVAVEGGILVRTSRMDELVVDPVRRTARVGAGLTWGPVLAAAQAHGLAPLLGSAPHVGVVGYTLGGGLGWLARRHGLAADKLLAIEVVLPDGTVIACSRDRDPGLFDALRGGGVGALGVVTALEMALVEVGTVVGGSLLYPVEGAAAVADRYRAWAADLPEAMTAAFAVVNYPPFEAVPAPVRGRSFAVVRGCHCGDPAEAEALLDAWRGWRTPAVDLMGPMPFSAVAAISQDPVDPLAAVASSVVIGDLEETAAATIIRHTAPAGGPPALAFTEARLLGGAIGRGDSPVGDRLAGAGHAVTWVAPVPVPDAAPAAAAATMGLRDALAPHATGAAYLNFLDLDERRAGARDAVSADAWTRLQAVRATVDPAGVVASGVL